MMQAIDRTRTPPRQKGGRHFGTLLSANSPTPPPLSSSSSIKKLKIRRSSQTRPLGSTTVTTNLPLNSTHSTPSSLPKPQQHPEQQYNHHETSYTVTFGPGPIGLQLEPYGMNGCRVQRFVQNVGGSNKPGPAQLCGKIQPGDIVIQVNGYAIQSYDEAVQQLKDSTQSRRITFLAKSDQYRNNHFTVITDQKDIVQQSLDSAVINRSIMKTKLPGTVRRTPIQTNESVDPTLSNATLEIPIKLLGNNDRDDDSSSSSSEMDGSTLNGSETASHHTSRDPQEKVILSQIWTNGHGGGSSSDSSSRSVTRIIDDENESNQFSPSKVKQLTTTIRSSSTSRTGQLNSSSSTGSVLGVVVKHVVPAAASTVASGSLMVGAFMSRKLGEALVGHSSREFDHAVQHKLELLKELSETKVKLENQQTTLQTLIHGHAIEKLRMEQELIRLRQDVEHQEGMWQKELNQRESDIVILQKFRDEEQLDWKDQLIQMRNDLASMKQQKIDLEDQLYQQEQQNQNQCIQYEQNVKDLEVKHQEALQLLVNAKTDFGEREEQWKKTQSELEQQCITLQWKNEDLNNEVQVVHNQCKDQSTMVHELSNQRMIDQQESERILQEQIEVARNQCRKEVTEQYTNVIQRLERSQLEMKNKLHESHNELERVKVVRLSITGLETTITELTNQNSDLQLTLLKSTNQEAKLLADLEQERLQHRNISESFKSTERTLQEQIQELKTVSEEYKSHLSLAQSELESSKVNVARLSERLLHMEALYEKSDTLEKNLIDSKDELQGARDREKFALTELAETRKIINNLENRIFELNRRNNDHQSALRDFVEEKARLQADLERARSQLVEVGDSYRSGERIQREQVDTLEQQSQEWKSEADRYKTELMASLADLKSSKEELDLVSHQLHQAEAALDGGRVELALANEKNSLLESHVADLNTKINELQSDFASDEAMLRDDLAHARSNFVEAVNAHKLTEVYLTERIDTLAKECLDSNAEVQTTKAELQNIYSEWESSKEQLALLSHQIQQTEQLRQENDTMKCKLQDSKVAERLAASEITNLQKSVAALNNKNVDFSNVCEENNNLRLALQDSSNEDARLRADLERVRSQLVEVRDSYQSTERNLREQLTTSDQKNNDLKSELDTSKTELARFVSELKSNSEEHTRISHLLQMAEVAKQEAFAKIAELERGLHDRECQVNELKLSLGDASIASEAKFSDALREIAKLNQHLQSVESAKSKSEREATSLYEQNTIMLSKVDALQATLDEKQSQLSQTNLELVKATGNLEDTISDLRRTLDELNSCKSALQIVQSQYSQLSDRLSIVSENSANEQEQLASETTLLREELKVAKSHNADLERLLWSIRRSLSEVEARNAALQEELLSERASIRELRSSVDTSAIHLKNTIDQLNDEVANYRSMQTVATSELSELCVEKNALLQEMELLKRECDDRQVQVREANQRKEDIEKRLAKENERSVALSEDLRGTQSELSRVRRDFDEAQHQHDDELRKMKSNMELTSRKHIEWLDEKEKHLIGLQHAQEQLRQKDADIFILQESLKRSKEEIDHLTVLVDDLRTRESIKIEKLLKTHETEVHRILNEKDELEAALQMAETDRENVHSQLDQTEDVLMSIRSERDHLSVEKNKMSLALYKAEDKLAELADELVSLRKAKNEHMDNSGSPLSTLSRHELKKKCKQLQSQLADAERRALDAKGDANRRAEHISRLSEDLEAMSTEIDMLIQTNDKISSERASTDKFAKASQLRVNELEQELSRLQVNLERHRESYDDLSNKNASLQNQLGTERAESTRQLKKSQDDCMRIQKELASAIVAKEHAMQSLSNTQLALDAAAKQNRAASDRASELEEHLSQVKNDLVDAAQKLEATEQEARDNRDRLSKRVSLLEAECDAVRAKLVELELEVESKKVELEGKETKELALLDSLENQRQEVLRLESARLELAAKMANQSQVLVHRHQTIQAIEQRALEAERTVDYLSSQVKNLQSTIKKLEASSGASENLTVKQMNELETRCTLLADERDVLNKEATSLRMDLREARRQSCDLHQLNEALKSRIESMRATIDDTHCELRDARGSKEELSNSLKEVMNDLENKKMEADHLRAKVQVLSATTARMKGDYLLLQEAALKNEFGNVAYKDTAEELVRIKLDLQTTSSKLNSLSEVYQSQQEVLAQSQLFEEQLLRFTVDVLQQADTAFHEVLKHSYSLKSIAGTAISGANLDALDLVGGSPTSSCLVPTVFRSAINGLVSTIQYAMQNLKSKQLQLKAWKKSSSTDERLELQFDSNNEPNAPISFYEFESQEVDASFSPSRRGRSTAAMLDAEYFQRVIRSLEGQIDSLLADLKSANDSLKAKDQLFVDLEQLVTHHESERELLEKKMDSLSAYVHEMEERLQSEVSWKEAAERELAKVREGLTTEVNLEKDDISKISTQKVGGHLLVRFIESRSHSSKATAFRHWACQTSALRAISQQGETASALAEQLETTREKLIILKKHLKKNRRNGGGGGRDSPSLESIMEGIETN